jgi:hypothetical protein
MREIEIHDYARQLLEAHGAKANAPSGRQWKTLVCAMFFSRCSPPFSN